MINTALFYAKTGKAPAIDIDICLLITSPIKFIKLLWSELNSAAAVGRMEDSKRVATFTLSVVPRSPGTPRLLPIFIHSALPSLIAGIDNQHHPDQAMNIELLVTVISSALTAALHLEWAVHTVCNDKRMPGPSSVAIARRLGAELRANKNSSTSRVIMQRLLASPSFVSNFPFFIATEI